ncbi:MAG: alpha/beta hydrolase [Microbacterium sp.]|uniref:alpha/beta fold hydrolase n=1 Tax=Microbacterium sp. TaxID=51671 RepID=UPI0039E6FB5A
MEIRLAGSGPIRVIALHGWMATSSSWDDVVQWLDPSVYTVGLFDARGYGARLRERGEYSISEYADDVRVAADQLGWDRFDLLGHSMGGKAAMLAFSRLRTRVERLVGVAPVPPISLPFDKATRELFEGSISDPALRAMLVRNDTAERYGNGVTGVLAASSLRASHPSAAHAYLASWCDNDFSAEMRSANRPVLFAVGAQDRAITKDLLTDACLPFFPGSRIETIEASSHFALSEAPMTLADTIDRFLRRPVRE